MLFPTYTVGCCSDVCESLALAVRATDLPAAETAMHPTYDVGCRPYIAIISWQTGESWRGIAAENERDPQPLGRPRRGRQLSSQWRGSIRIVCTFNRHPSRAGLSHTKHCSARPSLDPGGVVTVLRRWPGRRGIVTTIAGPTPT